MFSVTVGSADHCTTAIALRSIFWPVCYLKGVCPAGTTLSMPYVTRESLLWGNFSRVDISCNPLAHVFTENKASNSPRIVFWFATLHGNGTCYISTLLSAHSITFVCAILLTVVSKQLGLMRWVWQLSTLSKYRRYSYWWTPCQRAWIQLNSRLPRNQFWLPVGPAGSEVWCFGQLVEGYLLLTVVVPVSYLSLHPSRTRLMHF